MAKKIRFPLNMNGTDVRTIEELREHFDLESVLGYFANGKLVTWLKDRYYDSEANAVEVLSSDDEKLGKKLCEILNVSYTENVGEVDIDTIKRRNEKLALLRQFTDDKNIIDNVDCIAFNQDDLLDILDTGTEKMIYLCEGEFEIPLTVKNITYVGLKNPTVLLRAYDNVNFVSLNLKFVDICYGWDISHTTSNDRMYQAERLYELGKLDEVRKILKELAEEKNPRACYILYKINFSKDEKLIDNLCDVFCCVENNKSNSVLIKVLSKMERRGDKFAMFMLGNVYDFGTGIEQDCKKAVEWYAKAAELGNPLAQFALGRCYRRGDGVEQNDKKSLEWYTKVAEQGNEDAQCTIGWYYENGEGVEQDYKKAVEWYTKAAEQENTHAQYTLGLYYENGEGVEQDYKKAVEWYTKAAEQEDAWSQYRLGLCYENGKGVEQNYKKS